MRNRWNLIALGLIVVLSVFSIMIVWPGWPKRYLPDFVAWPQGHGGDTFGLGHRAMRLGLDLKGGTYVLLEADLSHLPSGTDVDQAMAGAKDVIDRRVNAFGVSETEISREGRNRLSVQLPGIKPEDAKQLIGKTALLEFRQPVLDESRQITCVDSSGVKFSVTPQLVRVGTVNGRKVDQCNVAGGQVGEVVWEPATGTDSQGATRTLTGRLLKPNARALPDALACQGNPPCVAIEFSGEGSLLFEQVTSRLVGLPLGIFLDEDLITAPNVQTAISGGKSVITGIDSLREAKRLSIQLNAGALPVPLRAIQESEVDATLGENILVRSVQAGLIGILAVMAFMILYYRLPGVLASMALLTYTSTVMMIFKLGPLIGPVTITLAGIAGFVLSVGMAVDANVLVFERMKEELRAGRNLASAIDHGFDRAWSSIRDSNVSTLMTCGILYWFGDQFGASLVKGFALTLAIGVLLSLFSAITVTRTFLRLMVGAPFTRNLWLFGAESQVDTRPAGAPGATAAPAHVWRPTILDFVKRRGFYYALSSAILVPGIISLLISPALKPGIEFSSGATFTIKFENAAVDQAQLRNALAALGHNEARIQKTSAGAFIVRTGHLEGAVGPPVGPAPPAERDVRESGLAQKLGGFDTQNFNQVSSIVSRSIGRNAAIAVAAAAVAILLYITWSFRNLPKAYRFGVAAVIATLHDAVFVLGAFSIFGKLFGTEINTMFITGLLTVIGFSVHDTIVVFDRIRENVGRSPGVPFDEVVNASLTETLSRSLNTSLTVLFTVIALLLLAGGSIESFLLVLLIGVISGTYSSIFVASQVLVSWEEGDLSGLWRRLLPRRPLPAEA
ncbi:MAG TPA: protein translocase subunit SecD [Dehalococcoidia bacterium]|nr:protein translocase subunit SecD [Dehalococcoidia bacterium]